MNISYNKKTEEQINQFLSVENIHELPDIFHYWSNKYLRPKINAVFDSDSVIECYTSNILDAFKETGQKNILSVGSGDCDLEIKIASKLLESDMINFKITCLELSPDLLSRAQSKIEKSNLTNFLNLKEVDINKWDSFEKYSSIIANHSLHHFLNLEKIFQNIYNSLELRGRFITNDIIGRNGHMRWPEVLEFVEGIWSFLPDKYKYNQQKKCLEKAFVNWDCSQEGFEGIRAQDILPMCLNYFNFSKFVAYGGIVDIFIDRDFGHNFDINNKLDLGLIDFIQLLDDRLNASGITKPTMMWAVMCKHDVKCKMIEEISPKFCLR